MDTLVDLSTVLQTTGGWGLSAVLMIVIWRLWVKLDEKDERIFTLLDKQNVILEALEKLGGK